MSYCRWSSDDFRCDLYVYADVRGGVTIHVAGMRHDIPEADYPPRIEFDRSNLDPWFERHRQVSKMIDGAELVGIGLPCDGESYHGLTEQEAADKIRELIALGYRCDPSVADELEAESRGQQDGSTT